MSAVSSRHRHHGQDRHGRLGPGARGLPARCARTSTAAASRSRTCTPARPDRRRLKPGASDAETNLFWHRGLSLSDIALGAAMLAKAERLGIGQRLRFR
jgi:hypothetical protein